MVGRQPPENVYVENFQEDSILQVFILNETNAGVTLSAAQKGVLELSCHSPH